MTKEELHRRRAEEYLAEAERIFPTEEQDRETGSDLLYSRAAHLRQCAITHALLSKD